MGGDSGPHKPVYEPTTDSQFGENETGGTRSATSWSTQWAENCIRTLGRATSPSLHGGGGMVSPAGSPGGLPIPAANQGIRPGPLVPPFP
jgi:hypothetical protein